MTDESARFSELRQLAEKAEPPGTMEVEQPGDGTGAGTAPTGPAPAAGRPGVMRSTDHLV